MMDNDRNEQGNEQGNDTAQAFQVGDRVRFDWHGAERGGEIIRFHPRGRVDVSDLEGVYRDRYGYTVPVSSLTLISRATPAPAPAQIATSTEDWGCDNCGKFGPLPFTLTEPGGKHPLAPRRAIYRLCSEACRDVLAAAMHAPDPQEDSEPATPAPDAMVIEGEAREWCRECDNTGHLRYADGSTDPCRECDGTGYVWAPRTIRLSDEALDRLAGELAQRIHNSATGGSH